MNKRSLNVSQHPRTRIFLLFPFSLISALPPPPRLPIGSRTVRQTGFASPIRMHDVNFVVAIPEGGECNPVAIQRPAGTQVIPAVGKLFQTCPIDVDHVNISIPF